MNRRLDGHFHARPEVLGWFGTERDDGTAELVANGYGQSLFRYGVGGYGGEAAEHWSVVVFQRCGWDIRQRGAYLGPAKYSCRSERVLLVILFNALEAQTYLFRRCPRMQA